MKRRLLFAIGVAGALAGGSVVGVAFGQSTSPSATPLSSTGEYYVDGARPTPIDGLHKEGEGCVQYSADRPDIYICDEGVPEGWTPPPKPYFDESICAAAGKWLDAHRNEAATRGESQAEIDATWPPEDPASCQVYESANDNPVWTVAFSNAKRSGDGIQVPYDPTGENPWAAHP